MFSIIKEIIRFKRNSNQRPKTESRVLVPLNSKTILDTFEKFRNGPRLPSALFLTKQGHYCSTLRHSPIFRILSIMRLLSGEFFQGYQSVPGLQYVYEREGIVLLSRSDAVVVDVLRVCLNNVLFDSKCCTVGFHLLT
jgi:hypothetical protein